MSPQAQILAAQIENVSAEVVAFVAQCPADDWRAVTQAERWPVCVVCHHIARAFEVQPMVIQQVAIGQPPPSGYTWETIHESNARQAQEWANSTKDEVLMLLQRSSEEAVQIVRVLSDEQLDRTAQLPILDAPVSVQRMIEGMIDHARIHLQSVRATFQELRGVS